MVPILVVMVIVGCAVAAICGVLDPQSIARVESARGSDCPRFKRRHSAGARWRPSRLFFVVLVAEKQGSHLLPFRTTWAGSESIFLGAHISATRWQHWFPLWRGGTPQTTYAENMGVMAMTGVFSTHNFIAAAVN